MCRTDCTSILRRNLWFCSPNFLPVFKTQTKPKQKKTKTTQDWRSRPWFCVAMLLSIYISHTWLLLLPYPSWFDPFPPLSCAGFFFGFRNISSHRRVYKKNKFLSWAIDIILVIHKGMPHWLLPGYGYLSQAETELGRAKGKAEQIL